MIDKMSDVDSGDKFCCHAHMLPFPSHVTEPDGVKYVQCYKSNNNHWTRLTCCYRKVFIMVVLACSFLLCGFVILNLPTLYGVEAENSIAETGERAETAHHSHALTGKKSQDIYDVDRLVVLKDAMSALETRLEQLERRNHELELEVLIERAKPQLQQGREEHLRQLVDQLEKGLIFLFPDFNTDSQEASRQLSPDERASSERLKILRDYLGNREGELAALRPDLAAELGRDFDGEDAAQDPGKIGLALQYLSNENAELKKRVDELSQRVTESSRGAQAGNADSEMGNVVGEVLAEEDRFLDEAERAKAADTRKSAFSVASSHPQLGIQGQMQIVSFDVNIANKGGDFRFDNNTFVCRIPGFYFFTFTIRTYDYKFLGAVMMKNNEVQVAINTDESSRSISSTQSTILRLSLGDNVWLRFPPSENFGVYSDGQHYTTFSGFLVFSTTN